MAREPNPTPPPVRRRLVYFSPVKYSSYAQRPHHMIRAFCAAGFDVLWVNPYPTRLPTFTDIRRIRSKPAGSPVKTPCIGVINPVALPIEPLPLSGLINRWIAWPDTLKQILDFCSEPDDCVIAIGKPSKLAELVLERAPLAYSFIDIMDEFPSFYRGLSKRSMKRRMHSIIKRVDTIYCSSHQLMLNVYCARSDAHLVLNGYNTENLPEPSSREARNVIGYVGSIGDWFDWELVREMAEKLPSVRIRLIGPVLTMRPAGLPPNIELIGETPQESIAEMLKDFAVGLIPFHVNELTSGVDPIKFYEYRSMGIPVWTTSFGEMNRRNHLKGLKFIDRDCNWPQLWSTVTEDWLDAAAVMSFRNEIDWKERFRVVLGHTAMAIGVH